MEPSPSQPWWRRWFGTRSEHEAERFLSGLGYRIAARNYRCPRGELDLVAVDKETVVFVEVRSTEQPSAERPTASVDYAKQKRLTNVAMHFLQTKGLLDSPARFDVLALSWPAGQQAPAITHYRDAFEPIGRFQMHS
jgi:putative endonuclease